MWLHRSLRSGPIGALRVASPTRPYRHEWDGAEGRQCAAYRKFGSDASRGRPRSGPHWWPFPTRLSRGAVLAIADWRPAALPVGIVRPRTCVEPQREGEIRSSVTACIAREASLCDRPSVLSRRSPTDVPPFRTSTHVQSVGIGAGADRSTRCRGVRWTRADGGGLLPVGFVVRVALNGDAI